MNELIRSDGTWSGFERNVFYANNGDGTFSDVSGAVDLDFIEDCRSFALADFDHDGRLEVVLKTRNSPQLRVLKNVVKDLSPSIAFRLTGKKSNRDAIGARIVVDTGTMQITRILHAGSGFLAQHSKELHLRTRSNETNRQRDYSMAERRDANSSRSPRESSSLDRRRQRDAAAGAIQIIGGNSVASALFPLNQ